MHVLLDPEIWASLLTLTALEIVLGIDNLVFIAITADRLPEHRRDSARKFGLALALMTRLALLASVNWLMELVDPVFHLGRDFSWRDIILVAGGLFLLYKGTHEIHASVEADDSGASGANIARSGGATFLGVIVQIMVLDIVFSLDSVITAVGMADVFWVMAAAITIAIAIMLFASRPLSAFINRHPTVRMLALAFLLLVGMMLVADGSGFHIPKGYIYAAIGFSIGVEALNLWATGRRRRRREAERRKEPMEKSPDPVR
jgi:predicted tellurium resistance membrane protein TerC